MCSKMLIIILFACSSVFLSPVDCYPTGAPSEACSTLTPMHGANQPSTSDIPFMIDISEFQAGSEDGCYYYVPGEIYNISLVPTSTVDIRGFVIQGRISADGTTIVGSFSEPETGRFHSCTPTYGGVTHNISGGHSHEDDSNDDEHTEEEELLSSLTFQWTAPPQETGSFFFRFSVVEHFDEFWVNAETSRIDEGECAGSGGANKQVATSIFLSLCSVLFLLFIM